MIYPTGLFLVHKAYHSNRHIWKSTSSRTAYPFPIYMSTSLFNNDLPIKQIPFLRDTCFILKLPNRHLWYTGSNDSDLWSTVCSSRAYGSVSIAIGWDEKWAWQRFLPLEDWHGDRRSLLKPWTNSHRAYSSCVH